MRMRVIGLTGHRGEFAEIEVSYWVVHNCILTL
jgi:hypothetical protein